MATSRPIREGDWLTYLSGFHIGGNRAQLMVSSRVAAGGGEHLPDFVLQADFGLDALNGYAYRSRVCTRVFGLQPNATNAALAAAITNGTAPGLYVREGDDTSNWEVYREVLARRVEEAMVARRGGAGEVSQPRQAIGMLSDGREVVDSTTGHVVPASPPNNEIRVGDVVEVVSCSDLHYTSRGDIGSGGRITRRGDNSVQLVRFDSMRLPSGGVAAIADVRKVTSSPPTNGSPMPDEEANSPAAAVAAEFLRIRDEVRRQMSSPLASGGDGATIQHVNPASPSCQQVPIDPEAVCRWWLYRRMRAFAANTVPPARSVRLQSRDFTTASITEYLQSLGATHIHISRTLEGVPVIEVTGLSQQAFDTARQNLPVGVQLRAAVAVPAAEAPRRITAYDRWSSNVPQSSPQPPSRSTPQPTPPQPPPTSPSRFSLLEIDTDTDTDIKATSPPQALKASVDLGALQAELRAEREAKRALAAAQTPPGRFNLLECDLPAVATAVPKRPVVSSPSPKPLSPVETITDLTAARSPLELARMLAGLDEELSTLMRQREAN